MATATQQQERYDLQRELDLIQRELNGKYREVRELESKQSDLMVAMERFETDR